MKFKMMTICNVRKMIWKNTVFLRHFSVNTTPLVTQQQESASAIINDVLKHGKTFGFHQEFFKSLNKEKVIVEFSSPNIAKLFHVGHFRSTVIGNAISNVYLAAGHDVCKVNYLGDWGIQFALLAIGFEQYGNSELLKNDPLVHLNDVYVKVSEEANSDTELYNKAQALFEKMEKGDNNALKFWKLSRELSIEEFKRLYNHMGVTFDVITGESQFVQQAKGILKSLSSQNLLTTEENGAKKINLSESSWICGNQPHEVTPIVERKNATTLYLTRDVAAAVNRFEHHSFDRMIYVTDFSQNLHFRQVFGILEAMGYDWATNEAGKLIHIGFGRVQNMRSRKGQGVYLKDILDKAEVKVRQDRLEHDTRRSNIENEKHVIDNLALTGLICHDLKRTLRKDYKFSWDAILSSKGSHGIALQYTHCRLYSLEQNCGTSLTHDIDISMLYNSEMMNLIEQISKYGLATQKTYETLEPSVLLLYLYDLCHAISKAMIACQVKGVDKNLSEARLLCFHCARTVLGNGMRLLGTVPLDKM
uniref:Probable arginine--tRNA ligase, mitochondrial n=1 Tax=Phallusia mammillata TaxID=59560 RepID=A0A6F9DPS7_9ASCI|nr:probable arginine--tRNA ligase, mitochondrial [Phallusia mammillata]